MSKRYKSNPKYLSRVRQLPCIICEIHAEIQEGGIEAHHPICGRFSQAKTPDDWAIPLCYGHHRGEDPSKPSVHNHRRGFLSRYGLDTDYINMTRNRLGLEGLDI